MSLTPMRDLVRDPSPPVRVLAASLIIGAFSTGADFLFFLVYLGSWSSAARTC